MVNLLNSSKWQASRDLTKNGKIKVVRAKGASMRCCCITKTYINSRSQISIAAKPQGR